MEQKEEKFNSEQYSDSILNNESNNIKTQNKSDTNINKELKYHFICKNCDTVPLLNFKSYNLARYICKCGEKTEQTVENLLLINVYDERMNNYKKIKINDDNQSNNKNCEKSDNSSREIFKKEEKEEDLNKPHYLILKCQEHDEIFAYYCSKCDFNICRKCLSETPYHSDHYDQIEIFDIKIYQINTILGNIKDDLKIKENDSKEIIIFKELMDIIIDDYKYFPNHSHFSTIESCNRLLQSQGTKINNNSNSIDKNINFIFIKNKKELDENIVNSQFIKKIKINRCNKNIISSMGFLNSELINLIELDLSDNRINTIEALANNKMGNLEKLNLAINEIDDSNIKYFFQLDFPKLKDINLYLNKLTDPELLQFKNDASNLPMLEIFYIGNNKFKFNEKNKNDRYDFLSVKELGISRNFFNQDTIKYIHYFTLTNLEIIYLSNNDLEKFDFIDGLDLPSIKEFWLNDNNFTIFQPLEKYKTLEVIEMKNNDIKDIDNIEEFVKSMNKLKRFNLEGNKFPIDILNNLVVEEIRKKCKIIVNPY